MSDLARCSNPDYVQSDLSEVEKISDRNYIDIIDVTQLEVQVKQVPAAAVLDLVRRDNSSSLTALEIPKRFPRYKVAVEQIPKGNLMLTYLSRFDGYMCQELMEALMEDLNERGLSDYTLQRDFRNAIAEVVTIGNPAAAELLETPIFKHLLSSKEEIQENFEEIFAHFLSLTNKTISTIDEQEKIRSSYGVLDFFPAFKEKINKRNNMNNMLTDALHTYIASKCSLFVCGDSNLVEKAKFLYKAYKIPTRVYHVETFIEKVEF